MQEDFEFQMRTPNISTYIAFCRAVAGKKMKRKTLQKWFKILVDKNDYFNNEITELIDQLVKFSNREIE